MYGFPIWNSTLKRDIYVIESVQRRFTITDCGHKRVTLQ